MLLYQLQHKIARSRKDLYWYYFVCYSPTENRTKGYQYPEKRFGIGFQGVRRTICEDCFKKSQESSPLTSFELYNTFAQCHLLLGNPSVPSARAPKHCIKHTSCRRSLQTMKVGFLAVTCSPNRSFFSVRIPSTQRHCDKKYVCGFVPLGQTDNTGI